jgi:hypothetical protein
MNLCILCATNYNEQSISIAYASLRHTKYFHKFNKISS